MNNVSLRKARRTESKRKKMLSLLQIAKLNDGDKLSNLNKFRESVLSDSTDEEPEIKRTKTNHPDNNNKDFHSNTESHNILTSDMNSKLNTVKSEIREYHRRKNVPTLKFKDVGTNAFLSLSLNKRTPIFLTDVQSLLLFATQGQSSLYVPRWCHINKVNSLKHILFVFVDNVSLYNFINYESIFKDTYDIFEKPLEIVTPNAYNGNLIGEFCTVPLTSTQRKKLVDDYGTLQNAIVSSAVFPMTKAAFPTENIDESVEKIEVKPNICDLPKSDHFPRTYLLLSAAQLVEHDYPIPLKGYLSDKYKDYVMSSDKYSEVTLFSPMFGLDCEMCRTNSNLQELTRVSVVNEDHKIVYESFVKPRNKIVDYLTKFSGITPAMLQDVTTRIEDVQQDLRKLLPPDAILVGQSLNFDLHALKLMHPYVIDTSVVFNLTGDRTRKSKLQMLAQHFLDEKIQNSNEGHCSVEDSLSSLKLVQLKLKHSIEFGDAVLSRRKNVERFYYGSSLLHHLVVNEKNMAIFGDETHVKTYEKFIHEDNEDKKRIMCNTCLSNKKVFKSSCKNFKSNFLSIANYKISQTDVNDENIPVTCQKLNEFIKVSYSLLPEKSLCIVVFGGQTGTNGVCFVKTKGS